MKLGYLHIGSPQHGIWRYGKLLAAAARLVQSATPKEPRLSVLEAEVILSGDPARDRAALVQAAQTLSQADVIHFQYNHSIWGKGQQQLANLNTFFNHCTCLLVVTLHDIFYPPSTATLIRQIRAQAAVGLPTLLRAALRDQLSPKILGLKKVIERSHLALVCTQEEARRLRDRVSSEKVSIVPHFVEARDIQISRAEAKKALNLEGLTVMTLQGFIYSGKGHELLVQALAHLPETVQVVFAGGVSSGHEAYAEKLMEQAAAAGVRDRIRVTGYLTEAELEQYLIATDLAICPFRKISASGSLSTWISVACPVLASQMPQVEEYNQLQPDAIQTFHPCTAEALLAAIQKQLPTLQEAPDPNMLHLRQQLLISKTFDQHLVHYRSLISSLESIEQLAPLV